MRNIVPSQHYVYTLSYPESMGGSIFYVGKGSQNPQNGYDRIRQHEIEARLDRKRCDNEQKLEVIREIWRSGHEVVKNKVAFFDDAEDAFLYEWGLINMTTYAEHLTNIDRHLHNGEGRPYPPIGFPIEFPYRHAHAGGRWGCFLSPERRIHHEILDIRAFAIRNEIDIRWAVRLATGVVDEWGEWKRSPFCPKKIAREV
jgi:hypothetical protein